MQLSNLEIPCEQFVLDNGLTVIVHEDHKTPITAVDIWYHVGSKDEQRGKTGFAHLFEHLMFGGSEHLPGSYIEAMERVGATDLNGTTSEDRTNYFENVPTAALDYALFAESDRMGHFYNTISQDILDLQRGVVKNEKQQGDNQPYAIVEDLIVRATYPVGHPYDHTVIGSMEDLDSATLEDVRNWFKTYYTPTNAVVVIAGDVTPAQAREKANRHFGDIAPGPPVSHHRSWVAKRSGNHQETVQDRVPHGRLYKVWNVPGYGTLEADHLKLAAAVLSSGKTSRLYKRLVYDDQIATQVGAYLDEREIAGQFVIVATAKQGQEIATLDRAIEQELTRLLQEGPTEAELARFRTQSYAGFVRGIERIGGFGGKADILATNQTYVGTPHGYKQRLRNLEEATPDALARTARAWLSDGRYELEVEPFEGTKATVSVPRSEMPEVSGTTALKLPELKEDRLSNGLRILVAERHDIPVVNLWLDIDSGFAADQSARPGTARLTAAMLTSGTNRRSALDISEEVQSLGAQLSAGCNLDLCTVFLSSLNVNLDQSLDLFSDIVLNPTFPEADFVRQRDLQLAAIANEKATPLQMALRALPPILFGNAHAYGTPLTGSGTEATVEAMMRDDVARFHSDWFRPGSSTMIVVGDTSLAEIKPKLEKYFGGWKPGATPTKNLADAPRPGKPAIYLIDKPGALHSVVIAGTIGPKPDPANEPVLEVANNVFGGTFGARLNMNLREEKHWTYGAASLIFGAREQRPFLAYASVQVDKTADTVSEIMKEFRGITGDQPIEDEELEKVKQQQILELPGSFETMNAVGGLFGDLLQFGLPLNYYDHFVERLSQVTVSDAERCAQELLNPEHMIWLVVADREVVEQSLRELNIGPIINASEP